MTEWAKKNTLQCEVVKIAMSQDKNGHVLKLAIHPNDLPKDLVLDPLGSRYVMVLARLNDQDEIMAPKEKTDGERAVASASLMCRNDRFVAWLADRGYARDDTEDSAREGVREFCSVKSISELATNEDARRKFVGLREEFDRAVKKGEAPK
jgi:hypothetical protein